MNKKSINSLRVLHGIGGAAGQPYCISRAQSAMGMTAHCLRLGDNKFGYPADLIMPAEGPKSYCRAFAKSARDYDVFHFYFRPFFYHSQQCAHPMGLDILALRAAGKAVIVHFRGSEVRLHSVFKENSPYNYVDENPEGLVSKFPEEAQLQYIRLMRAVCSRVLVTDPELQTYCPQADIVPRAINLEDWPFVGINEHDRPPLIVHAPSRRTVKGTEILMQALDRLRDRGVEFRLQLVENMSHAQARETYKQADIVVDQLRIGWYGVLSVEAMALGKPVLAYIREDLRSHLPDPPLLPTSPETLEQDLERIIFDKQLQKTLSRKARAYAEEVHDSTRVAGQLADLYQECLENPKPVDFDQLEEYINNIPYYVDATCIKRIRQSGVRMKNLFRRTYDHYRKHGLKPTLVKAGSKLTGKTPRPDSRH